MDDLTARFREVQVTLDPDSTAPGALPNDWLNVRSAGSVITFVDASFSEDSLGERLGSLFGCVRRIDAQPMALRSIFTALARDARDKAMATKG